MGDQTKLPPFPAAQQYASAFGHSVEYAQALIEDVIQQTAQTSKSATQCAFCGIDLAHYESAGLVVEYAGSKFCGETCLNSWIDGEGK
jgi:hypothetical protein